MPFLWQLVATDGSIAGDRSVGSTVQLRNRLWFSYPGYAEILLGEPHDEEIKSNDPLRNPYTTVLERLRERLSLPREKVATFASWSVFNAIAEHVEGSTVVNAGIEPVGQSPIRMFASSMVCRARPDRRGAAFATTPSRSALRCTIWPLRGRACCTLRSTRPTIGRTTAATISCSTRMPASTTTCASCGHGCRAQPEYRGRTHLLITTDHGRGKTRDDWRTHGQKAQDRRMSGSLSYLRRLRQRGVWNGGPALTTSQIAATLAGWVGVDWSADHPAAGRPIQ